jgi:hypothetical protein
MSETQFWHWIATGSIGGLVTILAWFGKNMERRISTVEKEKVEQSRFDKLGDYLATMSRALEAHAQRDEDHFAKLTDTIHMNHAEMLRAVGKLNGKE